MSLTERETSVPSYADATYVLRDIAFDALRNRELIKAATRHIDYVIIHELCHITHRKHSRPFYELLASKLPQWQRLKAELELSLLG